MKKLDLNIFLYEYNLQELDKTDINLIEKAKQACKNAYAPYSNFYVGVALLLTDGTTVLGSNQENAAYPSGLCAERTAIFAASSNYPNKTVTAIAITACKQHSNIHTPVSPCGACRQVILEYELKQQSPIRIILLGEGDKVYVSPSISNLLPIQFSVQQLK